MCFDVSVTWEELVHAALRMTRASGHIRFEMSAGGVSLLDLKTESLSVRHGEHVRYDVNHGEMLSFDLGGPGGAFLVMKADLQSARWCTDAPSPRLEIRLSNGPVLSLSRADDESGASQTYCSADD